MDLDPGPEIPWKDVIAAAQLVRQALADVRLLIFGGEACPPELVERLAAPDREVWNTYGTTEATVVACGARLDGTPPIRIGLHHASSGEKLEVVASSLDGRKVSLTRKLRGC